MLKTKHLLRLNMLLDWPTSCATEGRSKWRHGLACLGPKHQKQSSCFQMMGSSSTSTGLDWGVWLWIQKLYLYFMIYIYINILIFFNDVNCCIWGGLRLFRIGISGRRWVWVWTIKERTIFLKPYKKKSARDCTSSLVDRFPFGDATAIARGVSHNQLFVGPIKIHQALDMYHIYSIHVYMHVDVDKYTDTHIHIIYFIKCMYIY